MRVEHYRHELPEFGITVYGGLITSTSELTEYMTDYRPALFPCDELLDSLARLAYAPIQMTHSPRNNQLEPYPDLSGLLPYVNPIDERPSTDDPVALDFASHYWKIFLGEHLDWKLVGFQVYYESIYLFYSLTNEAGCGTTQCLSLGDSSSRTLFCKSIDSISRQFLLGDSQIPEMHLTFRLQKDVQGITPIYHVHVMNLYGDRVTLIREQRGSTLRDILINKAKGRTYADVTEYIDL